MPYSELIKNFDGIRDYIREFYVYGFKRRDEFNLKSARSYDNERRRIESWLSDYMGFHQTEDGKSVFISIDSRSCRRNPLYKAWKAKSFTDGSITLHFLIFDILHKDAALTAAEITAEVDARLSEFEAPKTFDASTVRKKLNEYVREGLLSTQKRGSSLCYRAAEFRTPDCVQALDFFSETAPCGVIGSYLLDKAAPHEGCFEFKHHYITQAMDSEILCELFDAMHRKCTVVLKTLSRRTQKATAHTVVPLRVFISVQNGRQYLMAYSLYSRVVRSYRLDNTLSVSVSGECERFGEYRAMLDGLQKHIWGVSTENDTKQLQRVEFTVRYADNEQHIPQRLLREKRCGQVDITDKNSCRFSAEVCDAGELFPWIRSFICRITSLSFSDNRLEAQFKQDLEDMYALYGLGAE